MQAASTPSITRRAQGSIQYLQLHTEKSLLDALTTRPLRSARSAIGGFAAHFEGGKLYLPRNDDQAAELLAANPEWLEKLRYRSGDAPTRGSGWEAVCAHRLRMQKGALLAQATSQQGGLPLMRAEQGEKLLQGMVAEGHLESKGDRWDPRDSGAAVIIEGRRSGSGSIKLLIDNLTAIDLTGSGEPVIFDSVERLRQWIEAQAEGSLEVTPAGSRVELPGLGGLGELLSWKAYIPGSIKPADKQDIQSHPAQDWLTAGSAALCREREEDPLRCDPLRSSVQRFKVGAVVSSAAPPQEHRLRQKMAALDLYRPASPYGQGAAPMSGLS